MSHLPCYILSGLLALMWVIREIQNATIQRGLIDKILVSRGSDELPPSVVEKIMQKTEERKPHNQQPDKAPKAKVHFTIPGMPVFKK